MIAALQPFAQTLKTWQARFQLQQLRARGFAAKVPLRIETERYLIKTAESTDEIESILKLRYRVFHLEYRKAFLRSGVDIDEFDFTCDHLMLIDKASERVVGTYRLIASPYSKRFYSETEFEMAGFLGQPGVKLELGRACVDKTFRKGVAITLLWRGLSEYVRLIDAKFLFGCSSVKTVDRDEIALVQHRLAEQGHLAHDYRIRPARPFRIEGFADAVTRAADRATAAQAAGQEIPGEPELPSLLESYLRAGARIQGDPALDRDFRCADFLTVLPLDQLTKTFEKKYRI